MKKILAFVFVTITISMICSCNHGHSKVYVALEKEAGFVESQIQTLDGCDDLQMLSFSILGLRSDLENARRDQSVSETEALELAKMADRLDAVWQSKVNALDCDADVEETDELVTSDEDDYDIY